MPKVCRLCTKSTINRNFKKLFDKLKLVAQIEEITGLVLKNVKSLPQHICRVCREDLQKAHEFRVRCINSQEYFNSLDFTGTMGLPSEGCETKNDMPIIVEFCTPEMSLTAESETKDELLIDERIIAESCFLKIESKDVLADELFDIDDSSSNSCNHSNCSADIHNDAISLGACSNVKVDTTKLNVTLTPQKKKLKRAQIIQQRRKKLSDKVIFVCDQCGMSFPYRSHFLAHQRRHNGEKVFHCEICPEKFFENWQLKVHLRKHKGEKPFACEICGVRFLQNNDRKLHVRRRHTNERPYVCSQCSKAFAVSGMLKRHMLTHTGEKSFRFGKVYEYKTIMPKVCRLCTKSTINRNSKKLFDKRKLVAQIEEITGIVLKNVKSLPQHICKVCREDLQKAHEFRLRCITSQEYFNSVDFTCTKDVPSEGFEIKHEVPIIDEFNDSTKVIVESCFLKTENKDVLRADNGLFDKDDSNCCGYKHSNYSTDMQHDELRLGASANIVDTTKVTAVLIPQEKKIKKTEIIQQKRRKKSEKVIFVCDQCGMSFSYRSHFLAHQRRHTGEKVFHCEICPEKFFENFQLKVHLRRHKGEKPFSCEFCGIRFLKNNAKKLHVRRRHTNVRPYVCSQCSKAFAVSSMLTNHMLTHTGEKTFRCDVCDIWFGRKTNLVKHYRSLSHKQSEKRTAVKLE